MNKTDSIFEEAGLIKISVVQQSMHKKIAM